MRAFVSVLSMFAALGSGCGSAATRPTAVGAAHPERCEARDALYLLPGVEECLGAEARAVVEVLYEASRAEAGAPGLARWFLEDGTRVFARTENDQQYEVTLSPDVAEAMVREVLGEDSDLDSYEGGYAEVEIALEGCCRASVRGRFVDRWGSGEDGAENAHRVRLERSAGGAWRIREMRTWLLVWWAQEDGETLDSALWNARDEAVEQARADTSVSGRRALSAALTTARRFEQAKAVLDALVASNDANQDDFRRLARVAVFRGLVAESRAATARVATAPIGALSTFVDDVWCPEEREDRADDEGIEPPCANRVLAELNVESQSGDTGLRAVGVVELALGDQEETSYHLVLHDGESWRRGVQFSDGPFNGNQVVGVLSLSLSDFALRDLDGDGVPEITFAYARERASSDTETADRGTVLCGGFTETEVCAFLPTHIRSTDEEGDVSQTELETTFEPDGHVRIRRIRGQAEVRTGRYELEILLRGD